MKKILLVLPALFFYFFSQAQLRQKKHVTKIPWGVFMSKGKITVKQGYKIKLSADKKVATVINRANNNISGTFTCRCLTEGGCSVTSDGASIYCTGEPCCKIEITIPDKKIVIQ
jgi:hypothetical protein